MILQQTIKFVGSMVVSDDTGQLLRLIQAITILCGLLIVLLRLIIPMLEWLQDVAEAVQHVGERMRYYQPYVPVGAG